MRRTRHPRRDIERYPAFGTFKLSTLGPLYRSSDLPLLLKTRALGNLFSQPDRTFQAIRQENLSIDEFHVAQKR